MRREPRRSRAQVREDAVISAATVVVVVVIVNVVEVVIS